MTQADNRIKRDTGIPREILQHLDLADGAMQNYLTFNCLIQPQQLYN